MPSVLEVRRSANSTTYLWDSQPTGIDRHHAERADPPLRRRVGHSWPGIDDQHAVNAYVHLNANLDHA